jgi:hypothetical protein
VSDRYDVDLGRLREVTLDVGTVVLEPKSGATIYGALQDVMNYLRTTGQAWRYMRFNGTIVPVHLDPISAAATLYDHLRECQK